MLVPFSPPPGINSDDTTFAASGRWADGSNVRFVNGKPQVIGGYSQQFSLSVSSSVCRSILPFNRSGSTTTAYGICNSGAGLGTAKLYVGTGLSAPSDRTPAALGTSIFNWSLAPWGSTLLASPEGGTLYEQSGAGTATAVATAPAAITYMLVTPQRQVIAIGCNEQVSGTFNALCVRGCDLENYNTWAVSATNNAFEHILDGGGALVAGRMVGQYLALWTNGALYMGQFIGDPGQTYRFDRVSEGCGLAGPNAVTVFNQVAYWMGPDLQFRRWTPGALPEIIPSPVSREFAANILQSATRYVTASFNARFNEIRFDYNDQRTGYPLGNGENRYIAFCLNDMAWHKGIGGRSAILDCGDLSSITGGPTVISAAGNGTITVQLQDTGTFTISGVTAAVQAPYIQSADTYLDESQRRVMIRGVNPDFTGQVSDVSLTLYCRDRPQSTAVTKGPYALTTTTTKKNFRASGKIIAVRLAGPATDGSSSAFRLGKLEFDTAALGERL